MDTQVVGDNHCLSSFVAITRPALHRKGSWHGPELTAAAAQQFPRLSSLHLQVNLISTGYAFLKLCIKGICYFVLISKGTSTNTATGTWPSVTSLSGTAGTGKYRSRHVCSMRILCHACECYVRPGVSMCSHFASSESQCIFCSSSTCKCVTTMQCAWNSDPHVCVACFVCACMCVCGMPVCIST